MLAVERVGDAEDGREAADLAARLLVEIAVVGVARVGRALAVVARDVGDDRPLVRRDAHDVGVLDQVVAVLVVPVVVDVVADVVQHRGGAQEQAVALAEGVHELQIVEELRREPAHLARVRLVEVVAPTEARARLEDPLGLARRVPDVEELVDELLEDALRQAHAGRQDRRRLEHRREPQEDRRGGDDGVRAIGPELVGVAPLAVGHGAHLLEEDLRRGDVDPSRRPLGRAQVAERVDVAAGSDEDVDPAELRQRLAERAVDGLLEQALARPVDRLRPLEVRLEHPHGAEGKRHREHGVPAFEQRQLRRAAAHVDEERAPVAEREASRDGELDEPRLLDALDGLELDPRLAARALDERAAVLRLAHGARRDRPVRVDLPAVHLLAELAQRRARLADRRGREAPRQEHLAAEPHRRAQRGEIFPRTVRRQRGDRRPTPRAKARWPRPRGGEARWTRRRWLRSAA